MIAANLAASRGDLEALKKIMPSGTNLNLNFNDYDKRRPIHLASCYGQLHIVKYLIEVLGSRFVTSRDRWNATALDCAVSYP